MRAFSFSRMFPTRFLRVGLFQTRKEKTDRFRNRYASDETLDDQFVPNDSSAHEGSKATAYARSKEERDFDGNDNSRRRRSTATREDHREILEAAARAGIRINGRVPNVGDFFAPAYGEPTSSSSSNSSSRRRRRNRRSVKKERENEMNEKEEREKEVFGTYEEDMRAYVNPDYDYVFEEEMRKALKESAGNSNKESKIGNDDDDDDDDEDHILIRIAKSKMNEGTAVERLMSDLEIAKDYSVEGGIKRELNTCARSLGRKFAAKFHVSRCLSEFDVLDESADGFYDVWRDETSLSYGIKRTTLLGGEDDDAPLPDLKDLLQRDDEEFVSSTVAYVVDRKSDDILNSMDEFTKSIKINNPELGIFGRAKVLAKFVSDRLGGSFETETKAFEIRAAAISEERELKHVNNSCVLHIGQLSVGAEKQRAILFKALASNCDITCRLLRGAAYCDGDDDCAKIFITTNNNSNSEKNDNNNNGDDLFFGNDIEVRSIDLLKNVGSLRKMSSSKLSNVEEDFFFSNNKSKNSADDINFDFFGGPPTVASDTDKQKITAKQSLPPSASVFSTSVEYPTEKKILMTSKEEAELKKRQLIRRQAERILEVQEAEEEKEFMRNQEQKFRKKWHKKWDKVVNDMSFADTLEIFGIEVKDKRSTTELRKAYRKALLKFHPDRLSREGVSLQERVNGEETFKLLNVKMEQT